MLLVIDTDCIGSCKSNCQTITTTTAPYVYSETCLNRTLYKPESCINQTLNKVPMSEIFVNLTCINETPVYTEYNSLTQGGSV
jgi:hypothetical protein